MASPRSVTGAYRRVDSRSRSVRTCCDRNASSYGDTFEGEDLDGVNRGRALDRVEQRAQIGAPVQHFPHAAPYAPRRARCRLFF